MREHGPAVQHSSPSFTAPSRATIVLTAVAAAVAYFSLIHDPYHEAGHTPCSAGLGVCLEHGAQY